MQISKQELQQIILEETQAELNEGLLSWLLSWLPQSTNLGASAAGAIGGVDVATDPSAAFVKIMTTALQKRANRASAPGGIWRQLPKYISCKGACKKVKCQADPDNPKVAVCPPCVATEKAIGEWKAALTAPKGRTPQERTFSWCSGNVPIRIKSKV